MFSNEMTCKVLFRSIISNRLFFSYNIRLSNNINAMQKEKPKTLVHRFSSLKIVVLINRTRIKEKRGVVECIDIYKKKPAKYFSLCDPKQELICDN